MTERKRVAKKKGDEPAVVEQPPVAEPAAPAEPIVLEEVKVLNYIPLAKHRVSLDDVLQFCFPINIEHPLSTGRLFLLAEYGPLSREHSQLCCLCAGCQERLRALRKTDEFAKSLFAGAHFTGADVAKMQWLCRACKAHSEQITHLRAGFKGKHIITDKEIDEMCRQAQREDILSAYGVSLVPLVQSAPACPSPYRPRSSLCLALSCSVLQRKRGTLTQAEQSLFFEAIGASRDTGRQSQHSREQVTALLAELPRDDADTMDFYQLRELVRGVRNVQISQVSMRLARTVPLLNSVSFVCASCLFQLCAVPQEPRRHCVAQGQGRRVARKHGPRHSRNQGETACALRPPANSACADG